MVINRTILLQDCKPQQERKWVQGSESKLVGHSAGADERVRSLWGSMLCLMLSGAPLFQVTSYVL